MPCPECAVCMKCGRPGADNEVKDLTTGKWGVICDPCYDILETKWKADRERAQDEMDEDYDREQDARAERLADAQRTHRAEEGY